MKAIQRITLALMSLSVAAMASAASPEEDCDGEGGVLPPVPIVADSVLPRDAEVGQTLHRVRQALPYSLGMPGCRPMSGRVRLSAHPRLAPGLYASGTAGIGVRVLLHGQTLHADGDRADRVLADGVASSELVVELVKVGTLSDSVAVAGAGLPSLVFQRRDGSEAVLPFSGSVTLRQATCRIPDVRVDLGEVSATLLAREGGSPSRPFQLLLQDCPAGLSRLRYRLDPMAPAIDAAHGIVGMDERATALNVGVQISDPDGQPLSFGKPEALAEYRAGDGGDYRIPLRARIVVSPEGGIRAGRVSTVLSVTMIYD